MTCALVIGGESWLNKVYANFRKSLKLESAKTIHDLYEQAHERGADHAAHIASIRHRSWTSSLRNLGQMEWRVMKIDKRIVSKLLFFNKMDKSRFILTNQDQELK